LHKRASYGQVLETEHLPFFNFAVGRKEGCEIAWILSNRVLQDDPLSRMNNASPELIKSKRFRVVVILLKTAEVPRS